MERDHHRSSRSSGHERERARERYVDGTTYHTDRPGGESYRPGGTGRARSRTPPRASNRRHRSRSPHGDRDAYGEKHKERGIGRDDHRRDVRRERDRSRERRRISPRRGYSPRRDGNNHRPTRSPTREARNARSSRYEQEQEQTPPLAKRSRNGSLGGYQPGNSPPAKREKLAPLQRSLSPKQEPPSKHGPQQSGPSTVTPASASPRFKSATTHLQGRSTSPPTSLRPSNSESTARQSPPPIHSSRVQRIPDHQQPQPDESQIAASAVRQPYSLTNNTPPTGPKHVSRVPPLGPASTRNFTASALSPPSGPASISPRGSHSNGFAPPSRPRASLTGLRGGFGASQRDYPTMRRASEYSASPRAAQLGPLATYIKTSGAATPSGPAAYRNFPTMSHASSQNLPRPQRFLNDLPTVSSAGHLRPYKPSLHPDKVKKLDQEAERLRKQIEDADTEKRAKVREWEHLQGEAESTRLGTELAAERLSILELQEFK